MIDTSDSHFPRESTASRPSAAADMPEQQSVTELVSGIVTDTQKMIRQQLLMMRTELQERIDQTRSVVLWMTAAALLFGFGILFVVMGLVPLLNDLVPLLPLWACWMIVGGCLWIGGWVAYFVGHRLLENTSLVPTRSMHALQEDFQCLTSHRT